MRNRWWTMRAALAAAMVLGLAGRTVADDQDQLVLRAVGFFQGTTDSGGSTCQVPSVENGIADNFTEMGLYNTCAGNFCSPTLSFPDRTNAFAAPCGGWIEVQNMSTTQGVYIDRVDIKLRVGNARRFNQFVPTVKAFPTACRSVRNAKLFTGLHLFPLGTPTGVGNTAGGVPHLGFIQLLPMVSAQVFRCLQQQYGALPADTYVSLPLVIQATVRGTLDDGGRRRSNTINYTLTLDHLCGNGAVDGTEQCDPAAPNQCNAGSCDTGSSTCTSNTTIHCVSDADCAGTCIPPGTAQECSCVF